MLSVALDDGEEIRDVVVVNVAHLCFPWLPCAWVVQPCIGASRPRPSYSGSDVPRTWWIPISDTAAGLTAWAIGSRLVLATEEVDALPWVMWTPSSVGLVA